MDDDATLREESRTFARYLLDTDPPEAMVERYAAANRTLFPPIPAARDLSLVRFVRTHRWSLPFLDAAAAILRPDSLLRKKILVMAAVLETSPIFAAEFLPREPTRARLLLELAGAASGAVAKLVIGIALLPLAERHRQ